MDVNNLPPPLSVATSGPLTVELRLGKGECNKKGCREGELLRKVPNVDVLLLWSLMVAPLHCRRGSVHFLLHGGRLSNQESSEGPNLRPDKHRGEVRSQLSPEAGALLGHVLSQPSEPATVGPTGWWVQKHTALSCQVLLLLCYDPKLSAPGVPTMGTTTPPQSCLWTPPLDLSSLCTTNVSSSKCLLLWIKKPILFSRTW